MPILAIPRVRGLLGTGLAVGLHELGGLEFDITKPWRCCCICGAVYQSNLDRVTTGPVGAFESKRRRDKWARKHARLHAQREHDSLKTNGLPMTPEAAHRLAAFGIIPIVNDDETNDALLKSSSVPVNDVEDICIMR